MKKIKDISKEIIADSVLDIPASDVRQYIIDLAKKHKITYVRTYGDEWAETVTRLSGDDVKADEIACLVIALKRAGKISGKEMGNLIINYLREKKD